MHRAESNEHSWAGIAADWCALWAEASLVVPLRLVRLARGGGSASSEFKVMIAEKVEAHGEWVVAVSAREFGPGARGWIGGTLRHYLPYVRANRRRLLGQDKV